jgi:hypothetical protein
MVIAPFANLFSLLPRSQRVVNPNRSRECLVKNEKVGKWGSSLSSFSPRANIQRHQLVEFRDIDYHVEVYFELT